MGGLIGASAPPAPPPPPPLETEDPDQDRQDQLKRRRRGRVGTIETSLRGVLQPRGAGLRRKTLLGE